MKKISAVPDLLRAVSVAALCAIPSAYGAGDDAISLGEFEIYQRRQELALEHEQALHAARSAPASAEEPRRQRRRFEAERIHQRQLLEHQRRRIAAERLKLRPLPRLKSSRGVIRQRLNRAQASERLSRKLLR
ncbi:MAG: hypothetical protein R3337_01215 [Gammaproteobacteria bacterium]|nr:hypothetical protein [Gammaproteobacteria bacterium]